MLCQSANGFGAVAATTLMADAGPQAAGFDSDGPFNPLAARSPHFLPRAKNVPFLYVDGGPSQVDTFAPQPRLNREDGRPFSMSVDKTTLQFDNMGKTLANP
jgi:hypothetical protein